MWMWGQVLNLLGAQQAAVPPNPAIDTEGFLRSAAAAARHRD